MTPLQTALAGLNKIASWGEGPRVNESFEEPASAQIARRVLTEINDCPRVAYSVMLELGREALEQAPPVLSMDEAIFRVGYAVESYLYRGVRT